jgi:septal ring factor EnvC (AmiA/AmiB activator)
VALTVGALAVTGMFAAGGLAQGDAERRIADRLAQLRREADELSKQGRTVLGELRRLELDRQIRSEELDAIQKDLASTRQKLADAGARAAAMKATAARQSPDVEARLVRLYKMGRAGYWRVLLDIDDARALGRAYRTAAALTALDRQRIQDYQQTRDAIAREIAELESRTRELTPLQTRAAAARTALDRAVSTRAALVKSIETRRDLAEQLAAELDAAQLRLQATLAQRPDAPAAVPFRPFRGSLPWPAQGIVLSRFGRQRAAPGIEFSRNGIELSLAEGQPVSAIHEGVVTHAGPFSGLGQLIIVDHGDGAASLYGYLGSTSVNKGDRVRARTPVGTSGRNTSGNPALYFELRVDGAPVDPLQWLRRP